MGYSTTFDGHLNIVTACGTESVHPDAEMAIMMLEKFCGSDMQAIKSREQYNISTRWCDWCVRYSSKKEPRLEWNGSEKSYQMYEWLHFIQDKFLTPAGLTLGGRVTAQGEDPEDRWAIEVENGRPVRMLPIVAWRRDTKDPMYAGNAKP